MAVPDMKWQRRAACTDEGDLFFGPDGERTPERLMREEKAKSICGWCPVRTPCRLTAFELNLDNGVWGGLGEDERASKRRTWLKNTSHQRRLDAARAIGTPDGKYCRDCDTTKPAGEFHKDSRQSDGLNRACKECTNKARVEARARKRAAERAA